MTTSDRDLDLDAVVVGSGPNGLVAAVTLAEAGWKVAVFEGQQTPGGALRSHESLLPGFVFDSGASNHPMAMASPAFRELGLEREGLRFAQTDVPLGHPIAPGRSALLRRDVAETAAGFGRDAALWRGVMGRFAGRWRQVGRAIGDPLHPTPDLIALGATSVWPTPWILRALRDERSRALLSGLAAHSIVDLRQPATALVGVALGAFAHGVGWPVAVGGSQSIADALVARLESLGGAVVTGERVTDVEALPHARAVILDTSPREALRIAGHRFPARYANALHRMRYGAGVYKMEWALDAPVPWADEGLADAGFIHLGGTAEQVIAAERDVARGRLPDEPFLLLSQASRMDPSRAPEGKVAFSGYAHVPFGYDGDISESIEARIEAFAPGFRERVLARRSWDPAALEAYNPNLVGGAIDGGLSSLPQLLARPRLSLTPWATPDPQVFLASASTLPGPGVHGMPGRLAARTVLARLG
ncbi:phytoene desaturase family protein [Microbacterium indicum]|uniref:phytoene desaturase family protein n=1 Tax=Microbacterium indicum TaxID=358100 RepID=UPI0003F6ABC7|nr:NAD(P)/FAD-dependent oxidoreductase [Microbacterium indicum]